MFIFFYLIIMLQVSLNASQQTGFSGQTVKFALTGAPFQPNRPHTINTLLEVANAFEILHGMIEDLGSDYDIPFTVNNSPISNIPQEEVINGVKALFTYIKQAQEVKSEDRYKKEAIDTRKKVYQNASLTNILLGLTYASEYKLNKDDIDNLTDVYIEHLFNTNFFGLGTLQAQLRALPNNNDVDKLVAKRLMYTVLHQKYNLAADPNQLVQYDLYPSSALARAKLTLYKPAKKLGIYPILSVLYNDQGFLVYTKENSAENYFIHGGAAPYQAIPLAVATNGSSLIGIFSKGTIEIYTLPFELSFVSIDRQLVHQQKISSFKGAEAAAIDFNEQGLWCVGCNKSIALFKLSWRYHIKDLHTYEMPTIADGHITHISMLDPFIAITYKTMSNEFEYSFFDIQKQSFIRDCPGRVEIICLNDKKEVPKKQMILTRDYQQFINRDIILHARGFTQNPYYDLTLDDKQDNIYTIISRANDRVKIGNYTMVPHRIKPFIDALNICVEKKLPETYHTSLTLDALYCISQEFTDLAPNMTISNELKRKISMPMRTAVNPIIFNRVVNSFLLGNRWIQGAAALGIASIAGFLWYQSNRGTPLLPTKQLPSQKIYQPAAYMKIYGTHKQ